MSRLTRIVTGIAALAAFSLAGSPLARAGNYYVYECSSYGNTAPAFTSWTDADHMSASNECMQPDSSGGYRSLEINNASGAMVYQGKSAHWIANSPSPAISIVGAFTPTDAVLVDCKLHTDGFTAQYFWGGGAQAVDYVNYCNTKQGYGIGTGISRSFAPSSYFGWGTTCSLKSLCSTSSIIGAVIGVQGIRLTAQESSGPSFVIYGSNNLWYQTSHWVRGGGWPVGFTSGDPSGVCGTDLMINGQFTGTDATNDTNPDTASFTQCWPSDAVTGTLDTDSYPNGPLAISYAARNAAGVVSAPNQTVQVDNTPVALSLSTPNDSDPHVWVNHAVAVTTRASAGPSGIGGTSCSTNGGAGYSYPTSGITLDGTGVWTVACRSWNNAFDSSGEAASSPTQSVSVHIDETPPAISFESVDPSDPQAVVVDTSDGQSGVAGGQIEMRPAASGSWDSLATQFDGARLRGRFDDAALAPGNWVLQATACDNAGNCASTNKTISLPVRTTSVSTVGFEKLKDPPARTSNCSRLRPELHWHHRRTRERCRKLHLVLRSAQRVGFGRPAHLHGLLTTAGGAPIADAPIMILTAPANGSSHYSESGSARTDSRGAWAATLAAGPSRTVAAVYNGSSMTQPSQGWARLIVPASVRVLRVWPRHVPWGGKVHIQARLVGGYLPPEGALVRLRLGYGRAKTTYGVQEHVGGDGTFEVTNTFGPGAPSLVLHYWLQECTLPEGDYPFAPACGPRDAVTVGGRTS